MTAIRKKMAGGWVHVSNCSGSDPQEKINRRIAGFCVRLRDMGPVGGRYFILEGSRMDAKSTLLNEKLESLLKQAAAVASELQGLEQASGTPHFDEIELPAHDLGQRLSRMIQSGRTCEVAIAEKTHCACPDCSRLCKVEVEHRTVNSMDGPIELAETVAKCRHCRRSFFPSTGRDGI